MKSILKIILSIGLIVFCSCSNSEQDPIATKTDTADSMASVKGLENPKRTQAEAKVIIDELYTRLLNGEDFATLAKRYSEDPGTNTVGGRYDSVRKDVFVPEFEEVVFNLKLKEISQPFLTEYGYHIATVIAIRKDELDVRHILIRFNQ